MTRLNQMAAVMKGVKANAQKELTALHRKSMQLAPMTGIDRRYEPKDENGDKLPPESTLVQYTVEDVNKDVIGVLTRLWDVEATVDVANRTATADIVVDGNVLVANVPTTFLLFLERSLLDLRKYIESLPTLDPSKVWTWDETTSSYRTPEVITTRTKKIPRNHVLAEATDKHPAQVEMFTEDVIVGTWHAISSSGAITQTRRRQLLDRVEKLRTAVQFAREEANTMEITDVNVGADLLNYVFAS